jgi:hypothetical protein
MDEYVIGGACSMNGRDEIYIGLYKMVIPEMEYEVARDRGRVVGFLWNPLGTYQMSGMTTILV